MGNELEKVRCGRRIGWKTPYSVQNESRQTALHLFIQGNQNRISRRPSLESDNDPRFISHFPNGTMHTPVRPHGGRITLRSRTASAMLRGLRESENLESAPLTAMESIQINPG